MPYAATKTWWSQRNRYFLKKKKEPRDGGPPLANAGWVHLGSKAAAQLCSASRQLQGPWRPVKDQGFLGGGQHSHLVQPGLTGPLMVLGTNPVPGDALKAISCRHQAVRMAVPQHLWSEDFLTAVGFGEELWEGASCVPRVPEHWPQRSRR